MIDPKYRREIKEIFTATPLKDVMTTQVHSVLESAPLSEAVQILAEYNLTHIPVVDQNKKVVGLLSHMYVYKTQAPRKFIEGESTAARDMILDKDSFYLKETLDRFSLKSIMKTEPLTLNRNDHLAKAISLMAQRRVGCILIVDDLKNLVGILTNQDVILYLATIVI